MLLTIDDHDAETAVKIQAVRLDKNGPRSRYSLAETADAFFKSEDKMPQKKQKTEYQYRYNFA